MRPPSALGATSRPFPATAICILTVAKSPLLGKSPLRGEEPRQEVGKEITPLSRYG